MNNKEKLEEATIRALQGKLFEENVEDEWGTNSIAEHNGHELFKSNKVTTHDGIDYASYLERDENGNGVRSFILPITGTEDLKAIRKLKESVSLNESEEETLEDVINRAHEEEIGAINTYDEILSKTTEETDSKLIEMIKEIKKDEEDHELLLKHYIETGEALTDDELEQLKQDSASEKE